MRLPGSHRQERAPRATAPGPPPGAERPFTGGVVALALARLCEHGQLWTTIGVLGYGPCLVSTLRSLIRCSRGGCRRHVAVHSVKSVFPRSARFARLAGVWIPLTSSNRMCERGGSGPKALVDLIADLCRKLEAANKRIEELEKRTWPPPDGEARRTILHSGGRTATRSSRKEETPAQAQGTTRSLIHRRQSRAG